MSHQPPYLLIVNGAPGAGKTTLAKQLHADLNISLVSKDMWKELLFDTVGTGDRTWSSLLGKELIAFIYHFANVCLANDRPVILENAFYAGYARQDLGKLIQQTHARPLEIYCTLDEAERQRRFAARIESGERHPGHTDTVEDTTLAGIDTYAPLDICQRITVDTGAFGDIEYDNLLSSIKEFVKGGTI
jgi:predicted kinase